MDAAAVAAWAGRLIQYAGAVGLFGWPLFGLYARSAPPGRGVLAAAAGLVFAGGVLALAAATATMSGQAGAALDPSAWADVLSGTGYGRALAVRLALALAAIVAAWVSPVPRVSWAGVAVGAGVLASFAWTGHAADGEGVAAAARRVADIAHLLAAGVWLGALAGLVAAAWTARRGTPDEAAALAAAFASFSAIGAWVVGVLVATGLVNTWAAFAGASPSEALGSAYGRQLGAKLAVFALMLGLAGLNRWVLPRRFTRRPREAASVARGSVVLELLLGFAVLAIVAGLGLTPPPGEG